jgi:hypothetical protein
MRYYLITITPLAGGKTITFTSLASDGIHYNGSCLEVQLDMFQFTYATPIGNPFISIKGVSYEVLSQVSNFNGASIQVSVGMSQGLPLANAKEAGLVLNGTIWQAFANWQGTQISLDLVCVYAIGSPLVPVNLSGKWLKTQNMTQYVKQMLNQAYPAIKVSGSFSNSLIYTEDAPGYYANLEEFSSKMYDISISIIKSSGYQGAQITLTQGGFVLFDGSETTPVFPISYYDIIGNLTWIDFATIQAKVVMRGDLTVGQYIEFPAGIPVLNTINSFSQYKNNLTFNGVFQISQLRHCGNSRNPDANSWVTIIDCYIANQGLPGITSPQVMTV